MGDPFSVERSRDPGVRRYDFRRPGKFSKEHLRSLTMVHENFARLVTSYLLGSVRTVVKTHAVQVEQTTFPEFVQRLSDPTVLAVFTLDPLPGSSFLELSPSLVFPILDRLFGGSGETPSADRPLTEIELAVTQRVLTGCLGALQEAWSNLQAVTPALKGIDTNPMFTRVSALNEVAVSVRIEASLGEHSGHINLCVPFVTLEPILVQLSTSRWFGVPGRSPAEAQVSHMQRRMQAVHVPIVARLSQASLSAREVVELARGDIILLSESPLNNVTVLIGGQPKFRGVPGTHGGRLAVQLTEALAQEVE